MDNVLDYGVLFAHRAQQAAHHYPVRIWHRYLTPLNNNIRLIGSIIGRFAIFILLNIIYLALLSLVAITRYIMLLSVLARRQTFAVICAIAYYTSTTLHYMILRFPGILMLVYHTIWRLCTRINQISRLLQIVLIVAVAVQVSFLYWPLEFPFQKIQADNDAKIEQIWENQQGSWDNIHILSEFLSIAAPHAWEIGNYCFEGGPYVRSFLLMLLFLSNLSR